MTTSRGAQKTANKRATNKKQKATKTTAKSTAMAKVPQPHGGALNAGGTPGNPGGGRRPDHIRQLAVDIGYEEAIPMLRKIINDPKSAPKSVISACVAVLGLVPRKDESDRVNDPEFQRLVNAVRDSVLRHCTPAQVALVDADLQVAFASKAT